jgi:hypothetical protein
VNVISRLHQNQYFIRGSIHLASSPDLVHWKPSNHAFIRALKSSLSNVKIGGGTPPVLTPHGWFFFVLPSPLLLALPFLLSAVRKNNLLISLPSPLLLALPSSLVLCEKNNLFISLPSPLLLALPSSLTLCEKITSLSLYLLLFS